MSVKKWWMNNVYYPINNVFDSWSNNPIPSDTVNSNSSVSDINYYNNYYKDEIGSGFMDSIVPNINNISLSGGSGLGSALSGIGSLVGGVGGVASSILNFVGQQQQLDYQKKLQKQIFEREDNAHQREVDDLRKAGLSPTLSAGGSGAGAGSVVSTIAPQFNNPSVDFLASLAEHQKLKNMSLQNKLLQAQIAQILANTEQTLNRSYGSELDNDYKRYRNEFYYTDRFFNYFGRFFR